MKDLNEFWEQPQTSVLFESATSFAAEAEP